MLTSVFPSESDLYFPVRLSRVLVPGADGGPAPAEGFRAVVREDTGAWRLIDGSTVRAESSTLAPTSGPIAESTLRVHFGASHSIRANKMNTTTADTIPETIEPARPVIDPERRSSKLACRSGTGSPEVRRLSVQTPSCASTFDIVCEPSSATWRDTK